MAGDDEVPEAERHEALGAMLWQGLQAQRAEEQERKEMEQKRQLPTREQIDWRSGFLMDVGRFFERQVTVPVKDGSFWSNTANAKICREIAQDLHILFDRVEELEKERIQLKDQLVNLMGRIRVAETENLALRKR